MVYVLNIDGRPLMPTERLGRVRRLLKERKAVIVNYHPFTRINHNNYIIGGAISPTH